MTTQWKGIPNPVRQSEPPFRWLVATAFAAALVAALLFSSQIYVSMIDHGHDYWRLFTWQLASWGFWAAVSPWVLRLGSRLLHPHDRPPLWPITLLAMAAGMLALHVLVGGGVFYLLQPYVPVATFSFGDSLTRIWTSSARADPIIFAVLVALGYGLTGFWRARRTELRESRLEAELAKAQLDTLRLEIRPHFLFNALNSIAAQVRNGQNDQALEMLLGLSELLRKTLDHQGGPMVRLEEELGFVRRYLELQGVRFADRLEVRYDVPATCLDCGVPFLLLQPLTENAIRHGLGRQAGKGTLEISARVQDDQLVLSVTDDGPGLPEGFDAATSKGVGLGNTRSKLNRLFPDAEASLDVRNRDGGGVVATVTLPVQRIEVRPNPATAA